MLFIVAAQHRSSLVASVLSVSPLVWLGKRSYSLYLWHVVAFALVDAEVASDPYTHPPSAVTRGMMLGAALLMAIVSHAITEAPFGRWKSRLDRRAPPPLGGLSRALSR
jgi:peptidoglycan/LPS O-acetylase OafA/YrhL